MADIPLDPRLQAQLLDLYRMSGQRIASTQPIHDAAMAMATRLAPGYARSAMGPVPQPSAPLTTGNLGQTGPSGTAGKIAAAAIAAMLADAAKNGGGGNIGKLIKDLINHFRGNRSGGPDSGPASIPGGSSDFNDWAFNTDSFNPERNPFAPISPDMFPGFNNPATDNGLSPSMFPGYNDPRNDPYYGNGGGGSNSGYSPDYDPNDE